MQRKDTKTWDFSGNFPHPFIFKDDPRDEIELSDTPLTLKELQMMKMSAAIRSKPDWIKKMKNTEIINKWKKEAEEQGIGEKQVDYVIDELEYYAKLKKGALEVSAVDNVWQADNLINAALKEDLLKNILRLQDIPEEQKDWQPKSNQQVLNLVHPSLYCLINPKTILTSYYEWVFEDPEEEPLRKKTEIYSSYVSKRYQWLPAEFYVGHSGEVSIKSYINNLNPKWNSEMYLIIADIFKEFIPLFNEVLTSIVNPRENRITDDHYYESPQTSSLSSDEYGFESKTLIFPGPPKFELPDLENRTMVDIKGKNLQVIFKLSNIQLTPDKPKYEGGSWHVEGMANEHIVATGIYYYSTNNVTESSLNFRKAVGEVELEQDDERGLKEVYGLYRDEPSNQEIGKIVTKEDRLIVFPNIYQHKVSPFELIDKTKPGHRKILVFFLVDPYYKILSTLDVPPQNMSWIVSDLESIDYFKRFPKSILTKIAGFFPNAMTEKEAKEHRLKLMEERKYFTDSNNENCFERPFDLCEH